MRERGHARGGAAGLAADLVHRVTRGQWGPACGRERGAGESRAVDCARREPDVWTVGRAGRVPRRAGNRRVPRPPCGGRGWPIGRVRGETARPMTDVRETNPRWRGGGPPFPLRWAFVGRQPRGGADKRPGSARPRRREWVRMAPCSGNPLGVRAVCQPEEPRGPFALTPRPEAERVEQERVE